MLLATTADGLPSDEATVWVVVLGVGLVVLAVVIALLWWLLQVVIGIDEGVQKVWRSATHVAGNTATTWQLRETAAALAAVKDEALRHDELLGRLT